MAGEVEDPEAGRGRVATMSDRHHARLMLGVLIATALMVFAALAAALVVARW